MLLKYIVKNYKSIAHPIEYSMFPIQDSDIQDNLLMTIDTVMGEWRVLRRGALLGPNASGKSNFIESVNFARKYIVEAQKSGSMTGIRKFRGEFADIGQNSTFQFMFYHGKEVYEFGFTLDAYRVQEEWLMKLTKDGFEPIFQRQTNEDDETQIEISALFAEDKSREQELANLLIGTIKKNQRNQLFLYKLSENGVEIAENVMEWFERIQVIFPSSKVRMLEMRLMENQDLASFLSAKLINYDTGINKIFAQTKKVQLSKMLRDMEIPQEIKEEILEKREGLVSIHGRLFVFNEENGEPMLCEMILEHELADKVYSFHRDEESDGTKRLLDLFPILFGLKDRKSVFFIDELDRCLHTKLTKTFINDFVEEVHQNQLIFTAHDVNLVSLEDMDQNEIWFIEKRKTGESHLKPFSDYILLEDAKEGYSTVKSYLAGRFGAVPVIKEG